MSKLDIVGFSLSPYAFTVMATIKTWRKFPLFSHINYGPIKPWDISEIRERERKMVRKGRMRNILKKENSDRIRTFLK